jgi:CDP-diacylglycerol---glycerol-3-phosphate 3-phosphatidyltransferase
MRRKMEERSYRGIYAIKPWWQQRLAGLENQLVERHVHPDLVTLVGVGCAGCMGAMLALSAQQPLLVVAVPFLAIGRLAANALDGLVARRTGLARAWGEVFNEGCDRIADVLIFVGLVLNSRVIAPLAWSVLVLTLLSSYLGLAGKAAGGKRQFGGLLAKADRMIFMALFAPLVLFFGGSTWNILLWAFVPALLLTIAQRAYWIYAELQQR